MCGIVGYAGTKAAAPLLLDALGRLEYRGYDSAGLAIINNGEISIQKQKGRLKKLYDLTDGGSTMPGCVGVGHTRWATHGEPSDQNSHPHSSNDGTVALVHNGIIENYIELKQFLTSKGYVFSSETDTEALVHLLNFLYNGDPVEAIRETLDRVSGSYALGILFSDRPDHLFAARKDSPLIIGLSDDGNFIASDVPAILNHTREIFRLGEHELADITADGVKVYDAFGSEIEKEITHVTWDASSAEKGGHEHFMIKEILEQPAVIKNTVQPRIQSGRIELGLKHLSDEDLRQIDRIFIVACGSAYHVGAAGKAMLQKYFGLPVTVELASEFRYNDPLVDGRTLTIIISQSGETLDTLFALREAKQKGSKIVSVVNVVGSSIATESDDVIYTWAGPEIAVATTKAYTAQLTVLYLLALHAGRVRGTVTPQETARLIGELDKLPEQVAELLGSQDHLKYLASLFFNCSSIFFIGRNVDYALALEGSLKLKEISYIHSEAYAAGELKHGTISLIEKGTLVISLCCYEPLIEKMISNMKEVKARGATVIALAHEGSRQVEEAADHMIWLPECDQFTMPSLTVIPLQLFAYYVASLKGLDIDKPRNLAKSVTVE